MDMKNKSALENTVESKYKLTRAES